MPKNLICPRQARGAIGRTPPIRKSSIHALVIRERVTRVSAYK